MTYLISEQLSMDLAFDGIMNFDDLKVEDKRTLALQLFKEESDYGDQISQLIDSEFFRPIPQLILATFTTKDPSPGNNVSNRLIGRMIKDNFRDEVLSNCLKCLVQTYEPRMRDLINNAVCDLAESNAEHHSDDVMDDGMDDVLEILS